MFGKGELVVSPPTPLAGSPPITPTTEPQEVWQLQINCISDSIPVSTSARCHKTLALLIGTHADAEARLKASVNLPNCHKTQARDWYSITYEFSDYSKQQKIGRSPMHREALSVAYQKT